MLSKVMGDNFDENLTERQIKNLSVINHSGTDLLNLINDILDISKIEAGQLDVTVENIDIEKLTESMRVKMGLLAKHKNIDFKISISENLPKEFYSDRTRIEQIMKNLLSNAIKFTERGSVTLSFFSPDRGQDFLNLKGEKRIVAFSVKDTGIGIPPEKREHVFEAFKQVDAATTRKYGGTGLGLSITKQLVGLLGGEIVLESDFGKGSAFTVYLPEKYEAPQKMSKLQSKEWCLSFRTAKGEFKREDVSELKDDFNNISKDDKVILIVDDDLKFANIMLDFCRDKGFKGVIALDGVQGARLAQTLLPNGILLDLSLPELDGKEVLEILKDDLKTRHIPVQIISGHEELFDAGSMGAIGFLKKPLNKDQLDSVWQKIDQHNDKRVKKLLIVDDVENQRTAIKENIGIKNIEFIEAGSGEEAFRCLDKGKPDCIILDLDLPDMSGFDFLNDIQKSEKDPPPIIVFTGKELSDDENSYLKRYAKSIIVKGTHSYERLIDDTALFLHQVESDIPKKKQNILKNLRDPNRILEDKKILLVDDDARNLHSLMEVFEATRSNAIVANNGIEALNQLDKNNDVDLVLMDMMMPEMDGYDATKEIRKKAEFSNLPIIALTAKAMKGEKEKCLSAGCDDYISKPVDIDQLLSMLRVWLYRGRTV